MSGLDWVGNLWKHLFYEHRSVVLIIYRYRSKGQRKVSQNVLQSDFQSQIVFHCNAVFSNRNWIVLFYQQQQQDCFQYLGLLWMVVCFSESRQSAWMRKQLSWGSPQSSNATRNCAAAQKQRRPIGPTGKRASRECGNALLGLSRID